MTFTYIPNMMASLNIIMIHQQRLNNHSLLIALYAIIQSQFKPESYFRAGCVITAEMVDMLATITT